MGIDGGYENLLRLLLRAVATLETGCWRAVLRPPGFGGHVAGGPKLLVHCAVALRLIARSMQLQAQGRPVDAWDRLSDAATLLPAGLVRRDPPTGFAFAALPPALSDGAPREERLVVGIARLIWREQTELLDLQRRFAPGRMKASDELIEGCILYLMWVVFDPTTMSPTPPGEPEWDDGVMVEPSRTVLCLFGTGVRVLADPARDTPVSQAPWQDIGGYRKLATKALGRLAKRPAPTPWCGAPGTSGLVIRRGCLRTWQHAREGRQGLLPA